MILGGHGKVMEIFFFGKKCGNPVNNTLGDMNAILPVQWLK